MIDAWNVLLELRRAPRHIPQSFSVHVRQASDDAANPAVRLVDHRAVALPKVQNGVWVGRHYCFGDGEAALPDLVRLVRFVVVAGHRHGSVYY